MTRRLFVLEGDALRPGDVLLSTQNAKASRLIRMFTRSRFSHAAIFLGDGLYAEAVGLGVRIRSIRTLVAPRLLVRRLVSDEMAVAQRAAEIAHRYVHAGYWTTGAMLALFRSARIDDRNLLFCSQLVARCYADAGLPLADDVAPDKTTPELLARCDHLGDVVEATFIPKLLPSYLGDGQFETLSDRESIAVQSIYADLLLWFTEHNLPLPPSWVDMLVVLADSKDATLQQSLDRAMQQALVNHGYLKIPLQALHECVIPLDRELEDLPSKQLTVAHARLDHYYFQEGYHTLVRQIEVHLDNERFYTEEYERTGLRTFDLLAADAKALAATTQRIADLSVAMMNALRERYLRDDGMND